MRSSSSGGNNKLNADTFAAVIGGGWEIRPAHGWRYEGLCYHWDRYASGRMILAKAEGFTYGIELSALSGDMGRAGVILGEDVRRPDISIPVLRVDSAHKAVRRLARYFRSNIHAPIVAVTGSVGKTSSCYLLQHVLGHQGRVTTNDGLNYSDGVVCEISNLGATDYGVIEVSRAAIGEATTILKPHVAVLTQVSPVHMTSNSHTDLLTLTEHKASLFKDLAPGGTAIINRDIAYFGRALAIADATAATVITFGEHAEADFRLIHYDLPRQLVRARILGEEVDYKLGIRGRHMAVNSLGVLAAAHAAGVAWTSLLTHCATAQSITGRGGLSRLQISGNQVFIIDDSFNASPASMEASFAALSGTNPTGYGRRIAVLADMLELGDDSPEYHKRLAKPLLDSGVDKVYLAGDLMRWLWEQLPIEMRGPRPGDVGCLLRPLVSDIKDGDVILLKGSHGTQMHKLAAELRYLSLAPNLKGAGVWIFIRLMTAIRRVAPYVPEWVEKRISWRIRKFIVSRAVKAHPLYEEHRLRQSAIK